MAGINFCDVPPLTIPLSLLNIDLWCSQYYESTVSSTIKTFRRYNADWNSDPYDKNPLAVELACLKKGGSWKNKKGETCGDGLWMRHYRSAPSRSCGPRTTTTGGVILD